MSIRHIWSLVVAAGACLALTGCSGTCCVITKFEAEPQWVCPGQDFAAKVHFRLENFDEDGNPSADGTTLWKLWDTTKAPWDQPGAIPLTKKIGNLDNPRTGVWETPASGVFVLSSSQTQNFEMTLTASNTECVDEGEEYLRKKQTQIEKLFDLDLDDNQVMTARTRIEVISSPSRQVICVPHDIDPQGGLMWIKNETRAGPRIVIDGVRNLSDVPLLVSHSPIPSKRLQARGQSRSFDGVTPNGKWEIGIDAADAAAYDAYINHGMKYIGKPPICIEIGVRCQ